MFNSVLKHEKYLRLRTENNEAAIDKENYKSSGNLKRKCAVHIPKI